MLTRTKYIMYTNVVGKAFLAVMQLLIFLTYDFAWRGPKDEPSCDCAIKQLIYNKVTFVLTILSHFLLWHVFYVCHLMIFGPDDDERRGGARSRLYCTCAAVIIVWSDELMKLQQQTSPSLVRYDVFTVVNISCVVNCVEDRPLWLTQ